MEKDDIRDARISALESKVAALEQARAAETQKKPRGGTNPRNLSPEQKAEKVRQLRAGKVAAKARREAEAAEATKTNKKKEPKSG